MTFKAAAGAVLIAALANGAATLVAQRYAAHGLWRSAAIGAGAGALPVAVAAAIGVALFAASLLVWRRRGGPGRRDPGPGDGPRSGGAPAVLSGLLVAAVLGAALAWVVAPWLPGPRARLAHPALLAVVPGAAVLLAILLDVVGSVLSALRGAAFGLSAWGAATLAMTAVVAGASSSAPEGAPDLVLISIDTLRPDRLGCYGYPRPTSPRLDALAAEGVRFDNAFSQATNTDPSHATLLTGLDPPRHGIAVNGQILDAGVLTLAEILREYGWRTAAVVGGWTMKASQSGLNQGFGIYDDRFREGLRPAPEVIDRAKRIVETTPEDRPLFLFVHLYDVHGPYTPPERHRRLVTDGPPPEGSGVTLDLEALPKYQRLDGETRAGFYLDGYDAEIRAVDEQVGRLLDALESAGRANRAWIVVLSDHGETLLERERPFHHGGLLTDEQIRIPLIVRPPQGLDAPRVVTRAVTGSDLLPSLLGVAALPRPDRLVFDGVSFARSLSPTPRRTEESGSFAALGVAHCHPWQVPGFPGTLRKGALLFSLRTERWKLVRWPVEGGSVESLYDLNADPGETIDVAGRHPDVVEDLSRRLDARLSGGRFEAVPGGATDRDSLEMLRSLGYVE